MTDSDPRSTLSRRRLLGAAGGTLAGLTALSGAGGGTGDAAADRQDATPTPTPTATPVPRVEWPTFQFDARNSGHSPSNLGPDDDVGYRWRHPGGAYASTPVVTQSTVFVADQGEGVVRAIDRTQGTERWRTALSVSNSRMFAEGDTLYVPSAERGAELQGLAVGTGEQRWSVNLPSAGNAVVVPGNSAVVSSPAGVFKVSTLSNSVEWHYDGVTILDSAVAVTDDAIYAADSNNGKTARVNSAGGGENWTRFVESPANGAPTVVGGNVIVPTDAALVAFSESTGTEQWRYEAPISSSVAVADGLVFGTTKGGDAFALDLDGGVERWRTPGVAAGNPPIVAGDLLFLTGGDGQVRALAPSSGTEVWSAALGADVSANPAVLGRELFLGDEQGRLWALAAGAAGEVGQSTPTRTETPTGTEADGDDPTDTPTSATGGTDTATPIDLDEDDGTRGQSTPTATPRDPGGDGGGDDGPGLGLLGAGAAAVLALLGGGLWWRNNQQDEYDPLG